MCWLLVETFTFTLQFKWTIQKSHHNSIIKICHQVIKLNFWKLISTTPTVKFYLADSVYASFLDPKEYHD